MKREIEVWLSPADVMEKGKGLTSKEDCVVIDVLRATSSIATALAAGVESIESVNDIPAAIARWKQDPSILLAGERNGRRILAGEESPVDFHLGNSPREFTPERVRGRKIVMTTTNGTKAIQAVRRARRVYAAAWVNFSAVVERLQREGWERLVIVCAGTGMRPALEDIYVAGALVNALVPQASEKEWRKEDGTTVAVAVYRQYGEAISTVFQHSQNGIRLSQIPEVREDLTWCAVKDRFSIVPILGRDGRFRQEA